VLDLADYPSGINFAEHQAVLFVCSTQGDGVPPNTARDFCDWLQAQSGSLQTQPHYSVLALGDKSYTHYCRCGKKIDEKLSSLGAKCFVPRTDVDKENWGVIDAWINAVKDTLPSLGLALSAGKARVEGASTTSAKHSKMRPFYAKLQTVTPLCKLESADDKETIHFDFDVSGADLKYEPGDALGIYPINNASMVDELLSAAGLDGNVSVDVCSSCLFVSPPPQVPRWHFQEKQTAPQLSLRNALLKCYDLHFPKPSLLRFVPPALW
jgi:sulfite reductase (NADPH) flavoprotein alpha-component